MARRGYSRTSSGVEMLRQLLTGPALAAMAGLRDAGEVFVSTFTRRWSVGASAPTESNGRDILAHVVDALTGRPVVGRLLIPMAMLFRAPADGEVGYVLQGRSASGPGAAGVIYGDHAANDAVPPWWPTGAGLYCPEKLWLESSSGQDVVVKVSGGGKVLLGDETAGAAAARFGDTVDRNPTLKAWMNAVSAATLVPPYAIETIATISSGSPVVQVK